jgi:NAD(P)-dependent dehydrogenase (short-subunit alcohol dehydrogenase family)
VLVNALLVGRIQSNQWVKRHAAEGKGRSLEAYYAEMGKGIPMGRLGTADEFANMALFLASDAGSYITGAAINIDGGSSPVV